MILRRSLGWLALASLFSLAACSTNGTANNGPTDTDLAAYAASTNFPGDVKTDTSTTMGTVVDSNEKSLRVLNFGENPVDNADVWINGSYVYKVDSIPSKGYVKLNLNDFYDHNGHSFGASGGSVSMVQLHLGDRMWTMLGPIVH